MRRWLRSWRQVGTWGLCGRGLEAHGRPSQANSDANQGLAPARVRRKRTVLLILLAVTAMLWLSLPASASAGVWAVKDTHGRKIGVVRTISGSKARVFTQGQDAGQINRTSRGKWTGFGFLAGHMEAVHVHHAGLWGGTPAWQLRGFAELGPLPLIGRIVRRDGGWLVQAGNRRSGYRTRGMVAVSCPAWAAGGAVFLVLGPGF